VGQLGEVLPRGLTARRGRALGGGPRGRRRWREFLGRLEVGVRRRRRPQPVVRSAIMPAPTSTLPDGPAWAPA
jgi:hypothetical protein